MFFGEVIDGMDVVDRIKAIETGYNAGHQDVPLEDVIHQADGLLYQAKQAGRNQFASVSMGS